MNRESLRQHFRRGTGAQPRTKGGAKDAPSGRWKQLRASSGAELGWAGRGKAAAEMTLRTPRSGAYAPIQIS